MSLETLLEKLSQGDAAAAEQLFCLYEPLLRMVVRRQLAPPLAAKFDAEDIVQSVWADVLEGFRTAGWKFTDAAHLRAFLVRVTQNRFTLRARQQKHALAKERRLDDVDAGNVALSSLPRPSEVAEADDVWHKLLDLCPPAHHELLHLKREGLPLAEIAARTGLHESSIRRILYDLESRFEAERKLQESTKW